MTDRYMKKAHSTSHSVQFSHSVVSDSLRPHESQHTRPPCPSPAPRVYSNSCPLSQWCHPAVSSSVIPFSSCPQSLSSLIIREMQIKTTVKYFLISVELLFLKRGEIINVGKDVSKRQSLCTISENVNWCSYHGK